MDTKQIYPKDLKARDVIVETSERGKQTTYPVVSVANQACSSPNCTHVGLKHGSVWCFDNTSKIEVLP